jgi:SAM-dependent methyltransferase
MYNLDKAYPKKFFARRKSLTWRVPIVCDAIIDVFKLKAVIDIGCGNGDLVKGFLERDVKAWGIEGTENATNSDVLKLSHKKYQYHYLYVWDLRKPFCCQLRKFDLAICFEVAEHIEPEYTDIFLDNLCSVSDRVLFSAAGPGQGGIHHHNCQPEEYWMSKFRIKNYANQHFNYNCRGIVDRLKEKWYPWRNKKGIKAYYQNLMYFERGLR